MWARRLLRRLCKGGCFRCRSNRTLTPETTVRRDVVRLELVQLYSPKTRSHAAALAFEQQRAASELRQFQTRVVRALLLVDWMAACRSLAAQGFHGCTVWSTTGPWALDDPAVRDGLNDLCALVAASLHCNVKRGDEVRVGDYATGVHPNGSLLVSWATLADAKLWRTLHDNHTHTARPCPRALVADFAPAHAAAALDTAAAHWQARSPARGRGGGSPTR